MLGKSIKRKVARVKDLRGMLTTALITEKLVLASSISLFNSVKTGAGAVAAVITGLFATTLGSENKLLKVCALDTNLLMGLLVAAGIYSVIGYIVCALIEARLKAEVVVINDLLAIRLAKIGTKKG